MKIFGIGYNKTGTTTLGECFEILGFTHTSYNLDMLRLARAESFDAIRTFVSTFDSFEDWPWPLLYKELDEAFPGSRFILTTRSSTDRWFGSLEKHAQRTGPTEMRELVFGHAMPSEDPEKHRAMYEAHNDAVRSYFRERPGDFLEVCWERGDGWAELCGFLERPIPEQPLPHANRRPPGTIERILKRNPFQGRRSDRADDA